MSTRRAQRLAVFDFDGTLFAGNSLHHFAGHLLASRWILTAACATTLRKLRLIGSRPMKDRLLRSLAGTTSSAVAILGEGIYRRKIRPRIHREGLDQMERARRDGCRVVIVSGAFDFLVAPFVKEWGPLEVLCCRVRHQEGLCLGQIDGREMLGAEKPEAIRAWLGSEEADWERSRAFTDHLSDLPLLAMVGERFLVNGRLPGEERLRDVQALRWSTRI